MTRKSITTRHETVGCDVCGRTLLRGEEADVFIAGGSRRMVCELCTPRATHEGWIREGLMDTAAPRRAGDRRGRSLLGRLRTARRNGHDPTDGLPGGPGGGEALVPDLEPEPAARAAAESPPASAPRSVHAVPTNNDLKMERALELFNESEHARTVAGVSRSLGAPAVAVRPSQTEGSVVHLAVAWELSWYRFEVDLADEAAGVRVVEKGYELGELEPGEREANAAADEQGRLTLAA